MKSADMMEAAAELTALMMSWRRKGLDANSVHYGAMTALVKEFYGFADNPDTAREAIEGVCNVVEKYQKDMKKENKK